MTEYFGHNWQQILTSNNLAQFNALWTLEAPWFEEPNIRRGGWSGVVKYQLHHTDNKINVFIKRQENHISKTFLHPIKGIATFKKEFRNIQRLTEKKIPTLELIYFGNYGQQAILVTKALDEFYSLETIKLSQLTRQQKRSLLTKLAFATSAMHHYHFQHNCFYPKHIFVKHTEDQWDIKFIDLEKLKRTPFKKQAVVRDLFTLYRHADDNWTLKDRIYFFKSYTGEKKLSHKSKKLWNNIAKKLQAKRNRS